MGLFLGDARTGRVQQSERFQWITTRAWAATCSLYPKVGRDSRGGVSRLEFNSLACSVSNEEIGYSINSGSIGLVKSSGLPELDARGGLQVGALVD